MDGQGPFGGGMGGLMQMMGPALMGAGIAKKKPGMAAAGFLPLLMGTPGMMGAGNTGFMNMLKGLGQGGQHSAPQGFMPGGGFQMPPGMPGQLPGPTSTGLSPYQNQEMQMPNYSLWGGQ